MHLFRELYFCLRSEKCMHKCNSLLTGFVIPLWMLLFIAIFFIYTWCTLSCHWLIGPIQEEFYCVIIGGKVGNVDFEQVLCTSWVISKGGIKSCAVYKIDENIKWNVAASHSDAWIQSLRSQHGIQQRFDSEADLPINVQPNSHLLLFKTKTSDCGPTISTLPLLSVAGSWTSRGCYEIQIKKLFDGFPWVKRDKLAFKNFHLTLLCKKRISDQDKSTPLMVSIKKLVLSSSLSFSYEEKCITVEKQREESRRLGHPVLAHCQLSVGLYTVL